MKIEGMSFSTKAIIETYNIRKLPNKVTFFINICLFVRDRLALKFSFLGKYL